MAHIIPVVQRALTLPLIISCEQIAQWSANEKKLRGG